MKTTPRSLDALLMIPLVLAVVAPAVAGSSEFTVQAFLTDNSQPVNNLVDIRGLLFDAAVGGPQVGPLVQVDGVPVANGLLTWTFDFGAGSIFNGQPRHLELSVRNPADPTNTQPFTQLAQRIAITPTPLAIHAQRAAGVVVPLILTQNDAGQPTLSVENTAPNSVALEILGDLTVGRQGELQVDSDTGNLLTQGSVNASTLGTTSDALIGGNLDVVSEAHIGGNLAVDLGAIIGGALDVTGNADISGFLDVGGTFIVEPATGFMQTQGDISIMGAYRDSFGTPGAADQFLSSTVTGTRWRDLIVGNLDMKNFAITNIGTGGSTFTPQGGLTVIGDFTVGNPQILAVDSINGTVAVGGNKLLINAADGSINVGPGNFTVDGASGDITATGMLRADDGALLGDAATDVTQIIGELRIANEFGVPNATVNGTSGDITTFGDAHVTGAYFDSGDASGAAGQFLTSTGSGTSWENLRFFNNVDAGGFAITNIGSAGSFFSSTGHLNLNGLLSVGPNLSTRKFQVNAGNGDLFIGPDLTGGAPVFRVFGSDGSLSIGPDALTAPRFHVNGLNGNLIIGPDINTDQKFSVTGDTGNTVIKGSLDLDGAFLDGFNDSPGSPFDLLASTGNGTEWINIAEAFLGQGGNLVLPGNLVAGDGPEDAHVFTQTVTVTSGAPGPGDILLDGGTGSVHVPGAFHDSADSAGADGQILSSIGTGTGTQWIDPPGGGGNGNFNNITVASTAKFGPDPLNPNARIDGATGEAIFEGPLEPKGGIRDAALSLGAPNQFLSSTGGGVQWRDLIVAALDMKNFAITNIGSGGSSFGSDGSLILNADLSVESQGGPTVVQVDTTSGRLIVGQNKVVLDAATGDINVGSGLFTVDGSNGNVVTQRDVVVGGDAHVNGRYFDSAGGPGNPDQILSSTGAGTQWRDLIGAPLDMKNFAITNIGSDSSQFTASGGLELRSTLRVFGDESSAINLQVNPGRISIGNPVTPNVFLSRLLFSLGDGSSADKFRVFNPTGDLSIGPDASTVPGSTFRVIAGSGDVHVKGAYFDSSDQSGNSGQILSSTGNGTDWIDLPGQGGDGNFNNISVVGTAKFGPDPQNPNAQIDGATGEAIFQGPVEPKGGIRDFTISLGTPGQVLTSTGAGVLWADCNCGGGGGSCITCNGNDATVNGSMTVAGNSEVNGFLIVGPSGGPPHAVITPTSATFTVPLDASGPFNIVNKLFTDQIQVSAGNPIGPVLDVTATSDFAPMVRFLNFLGIGLALLVDGDAEVTGVLVKGGGAFKIDHPLDPKNKYLYHSFVESPEMMNIYNGNVVTDAEGFATVELPDWFESLNRDFRYQLTVIGTFAQAIVAKEIHDGAFVIQTDQPDVKVSWQLTGVRQDAWANANRIPLEQDKPASESGKYLHPAAFGAPAEMGIHGKPPVPANGAANRR